LIEINLLPSGAASRRPASRGPRVPALGGGAGADPRVLALAAAALLVVLGSGFMWWKDGARAAELGTQVEKEHTDSLRLARTISLMKSIESRRDTIEQKIAVIRTVDVRRYVWPHLLDEISRAVPPYTWLTKVAAIEEAPKPAAPPPPAAGAKPDTVKKVAPPVVPAGPSFNVEGNAATTQALTRFMKNLEASPMIRDVALVTSEKAAAEGRTFLKFTLEARWETPDSALVQTVPVLPVQ
jgi:Tfp pilus assembly protein PilN